MNAMPILPKFPNHDVGEPSKSLPYLSKAFSFLNERLRKDSRKKPVDLPIARVILSCVFPLECSMQLEKPKLQRVYVNVTDPETRKSLSQTIYGSTAAEVIDLLRKSLSKKPGTSKSAVEAK